MNASAVDVDRSRRTFLHLLVNTLVANVTTSGLWFALTFWAYLETRSVLVTAVIGSANLLFVAVFAVVFGVLVDRLGTRRVMLLSAGVTLAAYLCAAALFASAPEAATADPAAPRFWLFSAAILTGGVAESLRGIALAKAVTLLVPPDRRDRANGLVGTVQGLAFVATGVGAGLAVGLLGMGGTLLLVIVVTAVAAGHLVSVRVPEHPVPPSAAPGEPGVPPAGADGAPAGFRGVLPAVLAVPGFLALIVFTTFDNLVIGVYRALMDAYGLTLFTVEAWGVVLGVTGTGFVVGGLLAARFGLGRSPLRTLLLANLGIGIVGALFTVREWAAAYVLGLFACMVLMPLAEAAEQTIVQRVVPYGQQGRVFGFAASVEALATPVAAFVVGPLADLLVIPYLRTAAGREAFGGLLGDGQARGIALVFVCASVLLVCAVGLAFASRTYRLLSRRSASSPDAGAGPTTGSGPAAAPGAPA